VAPLILLYLATRSSHSAFAPTRCDGLLAREIGKRRTGEVLDAIIDRYDDVIVNAGLAVRKHAVVVA
jgi:phosphatidylglycerophosphate synthase